MIRKMIYRYQRPDGGFTVSPVKPEGNYNIRWRLIADEGRAITDGENVVTVIDLQHRKDCEKWSDCEKPEEPDPAAIAAAVVIPQSKDGEQETRPENDREEGEAYDD